MWENAVMEKKSCLLILELRAYLNIWLATAYVTTVGLSIKKKSKTIKCYYRLCGVRVNGLGTTCNNALLIGVWVSPGVTCGYVMWLSVSLNRASLWSSCVVLPLLALTWMSAVLAMTDKRSILFQILFAVFDSLQGFVIVMVHCILRREVRNTILVEDRDDG